MPISYPVKLDMSRQTPRHFAVSAMLSSYWVRRAVSIGLGSFLSAFLLAAVCDREPEIEPITLSELATIDARVDRTALARAWATQRASENRIATLEALATRGALSATSAAIAQPSQLPPRRIGDPQAPSQRRPSPPWRSDR